MKKVFINEKGELNANRIGEIASIKDLLEGVCEGYEPYTEVVQVAEGVFVWFDNLEDSESIEDIGEMCEYIKVSDVLTEENINKIIVLEQVQFKFVS